MRAQRRSLAMFLNFCKSFILGKVRRPSNCFVNRTSVYGELDERCADTSVLYGKALLSAFMQESSLFAGGEIDNAMAATSSRSALTEALRWILFLTIP